MSEQVEQAVVVSVPAAVSVPDGTVSVPAATSVPEVVAPAANEYLLTVRVRFEAVDDLGARGEAQRKLSQYRLWDLNTHAVAAGVLEEIKLQEVAKSAPPRKVEL